MSIRQPPTPATARALHEKDLVSVISLDGAEIGLLFRVAREMKADITPFRHALDGRTIILLFEKASLRTRITFEVGAARLGGTAIFMDHSSSRLGERESIRDYGKNLERWVHGIVARVYRQETVEALARAAAIPVINGLSDLHHPCQALADFFTLSERFGGLAGVTLAYVGDGNNVCHSLMHAAAMLRVPMTVVTPAGFEPSPQVVAEATALAGATGGEPVQVTNDLAAIAGCHAVYTDTWVSMGQEAAAAERKAVFAPYQVTTRLLNLAGPDALFMHCLPAKRGVEVTDEVMDSPRSLAYDQAENRLHVQNAILLHTVGARPA